MVHPPNIIDVSIDAAINNVLNGNEERFIADFVDFKIFITLESRSINQKIANLNMKDSYPQVI